MLSHEIDVKRCTDCNGEGSFSIELHGEVLLAKCETCNGLGELNSPEMCTRCKGNGNILECTLEEIIVNKVCPKCHGSGANRFY